VSFDPSSLPGLKVTVMGLGLNGGGLASARFFAGRGARVTVTDLRTEETLRPSMEALSGLPVRYVLGRHDEEDFRGADLVVKNPAVRPDSPFLRAARAAGAAVETDLSVFLALAPNPVLAVTGSKGKSTTAAALHHVLCRAEPGARLGGNITVSPLDFLDTIPPAAPVVLELSSWQLGDLAGRGLLKPAVSAFTVLMPDHMDKYPGMAEYIEDKRAIFREQEAGACAVFNLDDPWQAGFPAETRARSRFFSSRPLPPGTWGAWLDGGAGLALTGPEAGGPVEILGESPLPGLHNRMNLLCAGLAAALWGAEPAVVREALSDFPGIEHRLEMFHCWRGTRIYNDSAATIPQATVSALQALGRPVVLITGGTDKNIDFSPLAEAARIPEAILLLEGTGTAKIRALLDGMGVSYEGPFGSLEAAVDAALSRAREGLSLLFSPGCTSFGMFLNEFDRGARFKRTVLARTSAPGSATS
jgi:UDP-N-acetylmuramoylalanine--D-glutamate ligase